MSAYMFSAAMEAATMVLSHNSIFEASLHKVIMTIQSQNFGTAKSDSKPSIPMAPSAAPNKLSDLIRPTAIDIGSTKIKTRLPTLISHLHS
jgi:hypothetical protein